MTVYCVILVLLYYLAHSAFPLLYNQPEIALLAQAQ